MELLPGSMATADMTADNPGTWLYHCHVSDHMENGMMSTFTIYRPPAACPVKLVPDDFANMAANPRVRVKNLSGKPIQRVNLIAAYLVSAMDLRPLVLSWFSDQVIAAGQEQPVEVSKDLFTGKNSLGVAFFPTMILYKDGTSWKPKQLGDCFTVYWRDQEHPQLPVLPPFQLGQGED